MRQSRLDAIVGRIGRYGMSFFTIQDYLILDKGSQALKRQFERHCNWCWGHGYGNCDVCKRAFGKVYRPMRIRELTAQYKVGGQE